MGTKGRRNIKKPKQIKVEDLENGKKEVSQK